MPLRFVWYTYPDERDPQRFPSKPLAQSPKPFHFHKSTVDYGEKLKVTDWSENGGRYASLAKIAEKHSTTAFLVIRNDTLLYEGYYGQYNGESLLTSYSIAKSFLSALVGVALSEGKIRSLEQPVTDFLPELKEKPGFERITLADLLNHTSGLKNMGKVDGYLYYGFDVWRGIRALKIAESPGTRQVYLNVNAQLMGMVLERATGQAFIPYFQEKIWQKIGAEGPAFWSTDRKGQAKTFCCLNAIARDFAKLGRLYLREGNCEGEQVLPREWVARTLQADTTRGGSLGYHFSWYLGNKRYADYMAIGLYKQHIYVCPSKKIVIVRLGLREDRVGQERVQWEDLFQDLVDQL